MDKIYILDNNEYNNFVIKYKNDVMFIKNILFSNFNILVNKNINILKKLVLNTSDGNSKLKNIIYDWTSPNKFLKILNKNGAENLYLLFINCDDQSIVNFFK